eukprot:scaffold234566_cov38-Prasinocladus_malaysianus.AAC.1
MACIISPKSGGLAPSSSSSTPLPPPRPPPRRSARPAMAGDWAISCAMDIRPSPAGPLSMDIKPEASELLPPAIIGPEETQSVSIPINNTKTLAES